MTEQKTGVFVVLYFLLFIAFLVWGGVSGVTYEAASQILSFLRSGTAPQYSIDWSTWQIVAGFIMLDFFVSLAAIVVLTLLIGQPTMFAEQWRRLLQLRPVPLFYRLLGGVASEELIFRAFPLGLLYPLWGTPAALWIIIGTSSVIFGSLHVTNQQPGKRNVLYTLPQILGGIILSYLYLAFGLVGVILIHYLFDVILLIMLKLAYAAKGDKLFA